MKTLLTSVSSSQFTFSRVAAREPTLLVIVAYWVVSGSSFLHLGVHLHDLLFGVDLLGAQKRPDQQRRP